MYSGYYCKKCKLIPFIKANITEKNDIKIIVKCKCHCNYLNAKEINKNYYSKNVPQTSIINTVVSEKIENEDSLISKIKNIHNIVENNINLLPIIKCKFINFLNSKINQIEKLFEDSKRINEEFDIIILNLINSYENMSSNFSNIKNIKNNLYENIKKMNEDIVNKIIIQDKIDLSIKNAQNLIDEIIPIKNKEQLEHISSINDNTSKILKLSDELLIVNRTNSLCIHSIKDLNPIVEIDTPDIIDFEINEQKNILCLYPNFIKILPEITYDQIKSFKKENINIYNIPKFIIEPIISISTNVEYSNIINWNDKKDPIDKDKFLVYHEKGMYFFKYDLLTKIMVNYFALECEIYKIHTILYNNENTLACFSNLNLFLYDFTNLKNIGEFRIKFDKYCNISIVQINNNELLIAKNKNIYILKLKKFQIKLKFEYENKINQLFLLNDKSIIICSEKCAQRYSLKTFEKIGDFHHSKNRGRYDELDCKYFPYNIYISNSLQLSETKIILIFKHGKFELYKIAI